MKLQAMDLVLRFDASSSKVLLLVPKSPNEIGTLKRFFEITVAEKIAVSEFADEIGAVVASFMHARYGERFKVDPEEAATTEGEQSEDVSFEEARLLIDRLGDSSTIADLEAIDVILEKTSELGDRSAAQYLREVWPELRAIFIRRISRETPGANRGQI